MQQSTSADNIFRYVSFRSRHKMRIQKICMQFLYVSVCAITVYGLCFFVLLHKRLEYASLHGKVSFNPIEHTNLGIYINRSGIVGNLIEKSKKDLIPLNQIQRQQLSNSARLNNSSTNLSINRDKPFPGNYKFYLTTVIMVRIYKHDKAKWTIKELKQWLHYLFYAGVGHVYLCDHFIHFHERLEARLVKYIRMKLLTYIEWPWNASLNGGNIMRHQVLCYSHVIQRYGADSRWQMSIDMDEYPFLEDDVKPSFLLNYLKNKEKTLPGISQILMQNFLMLGQGNRSKTMTIERITRITKTKANALTKPIYKVQVIFRPDIHKHVMKSGSTIFADSAELRMLHYWAARTQNWGPDTNKTFESTLEYNLVRERIAPALRTALLEFGELYAFNNNTGP